MNIGAHRWAARAIAAMGFLAVVCLGQQPQRVHVRAERFSFAPSQIKVKVGQPVELVLSSEDTQHGFLIRKLGVDQEIPARGKGENRVALPPLERGDYVFECSRACGAGHNMMRGVIKAR